MKQKKAKLIAAALFLFMNCGAQLKLPVTSALRSDVQKVVAAYQRQQPDKAKRQMHGNSQG